MVRDFGPERYLARLRNGALVGRNEKGQVVGNPHPHLPGNKPWQSTLGCVDLGGCFNLNHATLRRILQAASRSDSYAASFMRLNVIAIKDWIWASSRQVALSLATLADGYCDNIDEMNPFSFAPESRFFERVQAAGSNPIITFHGVQSRLT